MDIAISIMVAAVGLFVGMLVIGFGLHRKQTEAALEKAESESKKIREDARREADKLVRQALKEAKDESRKRRSQFEDEAKSRRSEISKLEKKIRQREQTLEKKLLIVEKREKKIEQSEDQLVKEEESYRQLNIEAAELIEKNRRLLQDVAKMSAEEARRELMSSLEKDVRIEAADRIKQIEEQAQKEAEERARAVVSLAVQRIASEHVNDATISVVALPSDEMKGRIIGREGRNIRAIEQATGIDLIIDDTPEAVIISCFNPIRREIAKLTLERLVADGRVHPARIEETAQRVQAEFSQTIQENGEQAAFDVGITELHPEIARHLGTLKYRTVGQQTVLQHSVETANICGIMASEMKLNVKLAKRAGLLHDIGKAVDQETEGHHSQIGADLLEKYDETSEVVNAVRLHHTEDLTNSSPYAVILHTANQLSSKRPGARRELLETYLHRLDDMEKVCKEFQGVDEAYVMQAGNEIRAMVNPSKINDNNLNNLADDLAHKLRKEMNFPGQVRVTVVREMQVTGYAK